MHVDCNATPVDVITGGRPILGHSADDGAAIGRFRDGLYEPLTKSVLPYQRGPLVVSERAGENLRCGGAPLIYQQIQRSLLAPRLESADGFGALPALHRDDESVVREEETRRIDRRGEVASRVATQVEKQCLQGGGGEVGGR